MPIIKMAYTRQSLENTEKWQEETASNHPKFFPSDN